VKKKKQDMSVRELYRRKLRNDEVTPDASVRSKLMKAQDRKEFLRFNPARLNVYYIGAILVALVGSVIIFSHKTNSSGQITSLTTSNKTSNIGLDKNLKTSGELFEIKSSDTLIIKSNEAVKLKTVVPKKSVPVKSSIQKNSLPAKNSVTQTNVNELIAKKDIFTGITVEKNKLQSGLKMQDVLFEVSAKEGCAPLNLSFYSKTNSTDSCRWTFGDGGYSNEKNPKWIFDVEGEYKVVLNVYSYDSIKATSSVIITVYPKPLARFEIYPDKPILPKDEIRFFNYSTNAISFDWDFGDGDSSDLFEPMHKYFKYGNYNVRLVATSGFGCSDSTTVINAFSDSEYFINFPNAFIPNAQGPTGGYYSAKSDEASQVFHPVSSGVSDYQLKIFSRLGILIFESTDINIGWDGYFKGQFSEPGVYIWKVRGSFRNGEPFIKTGDVTLFRN
jgi:PKD repeat protein